jgi:hypothetical protein
VLLEWNLLESASAGGRLSQNEQLPKAVLSGFVDCAAHVLRRLFVPARQFVFFGGRKMVGVTDALPQSTQWSSLVADIRNATPDAILVWATRMT